MLTTDQFLTMFPHANDKRSLVDLLAFYFPQFHIDTPLRMAHFFAQAKEEIGSAFRYSRAENLNYSVAALKNTFRVFKKTPTLAERYGRSERYPADQVQIANFAYANRLGNGDALSCDGWRYRGRGIFQLTGRSNYRDIASYINQKIGLQLPLEDDPDFLLTPIGAILSAAAFWEKYKMYEKADGGRERQDVDAVTNIINKHTKSKQKRYEHFLEIIDILDT
jgi:putative chitinase